MQPATDAVVLAPGAEATGFANLVADLLRQNLEAKPHKQRDFNQLGNANVALVADDADVALTLECRRIAGTQRMTIHDRIVGIPDVAIRGTSDAILDMANLPLTRRLALPIPLVGEGRRVLRSLFRAMRRGELRVYGGFTCLRLLSRLSRILSVHG